MEQFSIERQEEAKRFFSYYVDLMDNHRDTIFYYLSDSVIFDWFGKTIKGEKGIKTFLRETASHIDHDFSNPVPVSKIGFRETHVIKVSQVRKRPISTVLTPTKDCEKTPPNSINNPACASQEEGQGDGMHNCSISESPTKRVRLDLGDCVITKPEIKYLQIKGHVTFRKKSDKKYQKETKWSRPCKLEIAYSGTESSNFTIHLVIYGGNMKCKRNLMKDFEKVETIVK